LTPTPLLIDPETIRVYAGFRDEKGVSRIGYVDVDSQNPAIVKKVSENPALDVGQPGTFDDNGVILGDVLKVENKLFMYYVGFQLVEKVKFLAFTGLAVSIDGGNSFERLKKTPILDRSEEGLYIRAIHSVILEQGIWKAWYGVGSEWVLINAKFYPKYNIRYVESINGIDFEDKGELCITFNDNEYRIGRPRVYKYGNNYKMFYTKGTVKGEYMPGYAESKDGKKWLRKDELVGIELSKNGWDSESLCYPSLLRQGEKIYLFYNGNNMGKTGFGYAELEGGF